MPQDVYQITFNTPTTGTPPQQMYSTKVLFSTTIQSVSVVW